MSKFTRPTFSVDDDDLERLQEEFFSKETMPSAKVYRKSAPSMDQQPKKPSLFSQRTKPALEDPVAMPALEDSTEDPVPETTRTTVEDQVEYEPVMDPNPEPHVPVSKKMIDLTSLLGQVLGEITEHDVKEVKAPTLPSLEQGKPARVQQGGFPKPVHRSEFKKRLEAQRNKTPVKRTEAPPQVASSNPALLNQTLYDNENDQRIGEMSELELEEARQEIMSTLSPESIALLMKGLKKKSETDPPKKHVSFKEKVNVEDKEDLLQMKQQFYKDVPTENEKLAWMDHRFLTPDMVAQQSKRSKELEHDSNESTEAEKVYRKLRFDLQGRFINTNLEIPRHQGLHHHGDEPEKAGYTLAELFYLSRSQVPSQRAMVLTTLSRIILQAKSHPDQEVWCTVLSVFTGKEHAAAIYLRSALDDRNLVVLASAIDALSALVLNSDQIWEASLLHADKFNQFLGHIARPILPEGAKQVKRKGLNDKLTELVDRVRQTSGQSTEQEQRDDAALAERDLMRGLVKMDILPRIRYLLGTESDLIQRDPASAEKLVRILVSMAEAGQDVCESIEEEEILDLVVSWGILTKTEWPMTGENCNDYPSLAAVRLLTVLAQGSKQIAESIVEKATITLRFLATSPEAACAVMKQRAYALQLETLKLIRVLACYGYIVPTLEDLHGSVMSWLRAVLTDKSTDLDCTRASTVMGLLEVLLHIAADPHKSIPAHAIDWNQPTAYLPAVIAVLKKNPTGTVYESALGYLGAWATYIPKFSPSASDIDEVWKAVMNKEQNVFESGNSVALGYTTSTNHVLRYIQFIVAYASVNNSQETFMSAQLIHVLKTSYSKDTLSRYAFWLWLKHCQVKEKCWGMSLGLAELESGIKSGHMGFVETWLAQDLMQLCLSTRTLGDLVASLGPFYFKQDQTNVEISRALFEYDGRPLRTLMYTVPYQDDQEQQDLSSLETTAFILSPIDGLYHLDKSTAAQKIRDDAATVVCNTMELGNKIFYTSDINHDVAIITLMKIFLIGDREGQAVGMETEREVFMNERVTTDINQWLDYLCTRKTNLAGLENAWWKSSEYIRQAQVPFFQFYQGFVAQYAQVSFGHHGFARLLVYLVTQIDTIDYRHLLLSDYRDILSTIQVGVNEVPPLSPQDVEYFRNAGLRLL